MPSYQLQTDPIPVFCACTGGQDRSIRRWERTSEPFFVEEEKERRLESLFEADLEQQQQRGALILGPQGGTYAGAAAAAAAGDEGAAAAAGRRTAESVSAADSIMDALDVAAHETDKQQEYQAALAAAKVGVKVWNLLEVGLGLCCKIR
jgi:U3 small nucleolar RNA-associated protein 12